MVRCCGAVLFLNIYIYISRSSLIPPHVVAVFVFFWEAFFCQEFVPPHVVYPLYFRIYETFFNQGLFHRTLHNHVVFCKYRTFLSTVGVCFTARYVTALRFLVCVCFFRRLFHRTLYSRVVLISDFFSGVYSTSAQCFFSDFFISPPHVV